MILMVGFAAYLVQQIYKKTDLLLMEETGFTEVSVDSEKMKFPSITFCPASMKDHEHYNPSDSSITADWQNLPHLEDMLVEIRQKISINEYDKIKTIYHSTKNKLNKINPL